MRIYMIWYLRLISTHRKRRAGFPDRPIVTNWFELFRWSLFAPDHKTLRKSFNECCANVRWVHDVPLVCGIFRGSTLVHQRHIVFTCAPTVCTIHAYEVRRIFLSLLAIAYMLCPLGCYFKYSSSWAHVPSRSPPLINEVIAHHQVRS